MCFFIPIIFTQKLQKKEVALIQDNLNLITNQIENEIINQSNNQNSNNTSETYDYKQYNTVKLLHSKTSQIEEINLDEYLYGVVASEMPANFEQEALNAQAIVARTYTIYKIQNSNNKHQDANICDDSSCCQAWISKQDRFDKWEESKKEDNWNKITNAVNSTKGKIIVYDGKPINAFFHSNSGGKTETTVNVWSSNEEYPYLQTVETAGEENYSQYNSQAILTKEEFIKKIKEKYPEFEIDFNNNECIKVLEYTNGNRIKNIKIGNMEFSGVTIRSLLGLKSANFNIILENENIKISVVGYGHGVGMSQTGADSMAKEGKKYEEIIKHFYTGVEIINI